MKKDFRNSNYIELYIKFSFISLDKSGPIKLIPLHLLSLYMTLVYKLETASKRPVFWLLLPNFTDKKSGDRGRLRLSSTVFIFSIYRDGFRYYVLAWYADIVHICIYLYLSYRYLCMLIAEAQVFFYFVRFIIS